MNSKHIWMGANSNSLSQTPCKEIYGWLLGHYAVRCLMFTAAQQVGLSPLRLGFTGTLKLIRRAMVIFRIFNLNNSLFLQQVNHGHLSWKKFLPDRVDVIRVVKKPRSKFLSKKPVHGNWNSTAAAQLFHSQYRIDLNDTRSFALGRTTGDAHVFDSAGVATDKYRCQAEWKSQANQHKGTRALP